MTARLIVITQYLENYGAHDWDGQGECPQRWKFKGGYEYHVADVSLEDAVGGHEFLTSLVAPHMRSTQYVNNDFFREYPVSWGVYFPGELTPTESLYAENGEDHSNVVVDKRGVVLAS